MSTSLYANLVQEITTILDVIHETEAGVTTQLKKDLVQAVSLSVDWRAITLTTYSRTLSKMI